MDRSRYRVIGLAPSARAAAELAGAASARTDTLAKWLHNHDRLPTLPPTERAWTALDDRSVVIVDEASMAGTLELDRLITLAAGAAAKVVLVGDPAQIGVINGPGGMLAALSRTGHAVELAEIHRFTARWERDASLQLRQGDPAALTPYQAAGRLHPCPDTDTALDGLFARWAAARAEGHDALMLARTHHDVDALNARARTAALAAGRITGPRTLAGQREWQAGDLLRARRNGVPSALPRHQQEARWRASSADPTASGGSATANRPARSAPSTSTVKATPSGSAPPSRLTCCAGPTWIPTPAR